MERAQAFVPLPNTARSDRFGGGSRRPFNRGEWRGARVCAQACGGPRTAIGLQTSPDAENQAGDHERNVHMRGVIERHIDRFAFREAPLKYEWTEQ